MSTLLVGMQIGAITMEKRVEVPQKIKMELLYNLATLLLRIYFKISKTLTQKNMYIPTFIAVL